MCTVTLEVHHFWYLMYAAVTLIVTHYTYYSEYCVHNHLLYVSSIIIISQ